VVEVATANEDTMGGCEEEEGGARGRAGIVELEEGERGAVEVKSGEEESKSSKSLQHFFRAKQRKAGTVYLIGQEQQG
jgi:hypothetical protein